MDWFWHILVVFLILFAINYMSLLNERTLTKFSSTDPEGFTSEIPGATHESDGNVKWLTNAELYDSFYTSVYDQLCKPHVRNQSEAALILHEWTKRGEEQKTFRILDIGCGTGITVCSFTKMGVKQVVGLDSSQAMIDWAKNKTTPSTTLTAEQKENLEWRFGDAINPGVCSAGEFDHISMLYFTVYYLKNKEAVFRNAYLWTKPGGKFVLQVVNKHKFDPMLESASPWVFFSLQKYSDSRITRSEVTFDKFKYTGDFLLEDPKAEFRETFRFADSTVRHQKHELLMEDMTAIVGMAKLAGWEYIGNVDLTPIGFQYSFHLHFRKA
jgi:SAM-dependent methyltransferase